MHQHELPPPTAWEHLEAIAWRLLRETWAGAQRNGRQGQAQAGVDVFGRQRHDGTWAGAQVKLKGAGRRVTEEELRAEVEKAKTFAPQLAQYVIITSAPNDAAIQQVARLITEAHAADSLFAVEVWGWDEVTDRLCEYPDVVRQHFPELARAAASEAIQELGRLRGQEAADRAARERPQFRCVFLSLSAREEAFEPTWKIEQYAGDPVVAIEWRFRGPRFRMPWRQSQVSVLPRTPIVSRFDLREPPQADDLVGVDEVGLEIRFHWRGRWRHELHRWPIERDDLGTKVLWRIGDEVLPPLVWDED